MNDRRTVLCAPRHFTYWRFVAWLVRCNPDAPTSMIALSPMKLKVFRETELFRTNLCQGPRHTRTHTRQPLKLHFTSGLCYRRTATDMQSDLHKPPKVRSPPNRAPTRHGQRGDFPTLTASVRCHRPKREQTRSKCHHTKLRRLRPRRTPKSDEIRRLSLIHI